jgi:hypothetical protein
MAKSDHHLNALRILLILVKGSEPIKNVTIPGFDRLFDGETKVQALDFWLRYPDYLGDELLSLYESTADKSYLQAVREIFENSEPDVRRVPMLRKYFGAYEPLDTVLGILKSRNLVWPRTRPITGFANHRDFLVNQRACDLVARIPKEIPELQWYDNRVDLILRVAGDRGGLALKERQHQQKEYHDTHHGAIIPTIGERVQLRLIELESNK